MNARLPQQRSEHEGVTLVELLVVVFVLSVLGAITTAGIVTALNAAQHSRDRVEAIQELEIAGQRIVRELRAAQLLVLAAGDEAGADPTPFESRIGAEGIRDDGEFEVIYVVDLDSQPAQLIATTTVDGGSSEQVLITLVDLADDEPVFRYLDARGEDLSTHCGSSCAATFARAERIEVVLRREVGEDRPPIVVRSSAAIRNVRFGG